MPQVMDGDDVRRVVRRISHEILERHQGVDGVALIGIHTRGVHLARSIAKTITEVEGKSPPVGELEIGPYRDDTAIRPGHRTGTTSIPVDIDGLKVVLVDDVLYTGRTIRAALDALSEIGRAAEVQVAVLVDRGHRELPIRADYVGKNMPTNRAERVTVRLSDVDGEEGVWVEKAA